MLKIMKVKLIPAINVDSFDELTRRIRSIEPFVGRYGMDSVHLDVADGTFTDNTLWHNARDLVGFETPFAIEAHLMLADMDNRIDEWLFHPVRRIIFHVEACRDSALIIKKCRDAGISPGISIRPDTPWDKTRPFLEIVDVIQLLSVVPGRAGQAMYPDTLEKIRALRRECPSCTIEVDGGVSVANIRQVTDAGANEIVAASAIFGNNKIEEAIKELYALLT